MPDLMPDAAPDTATEPGPKRRAAPKSPRSAQTAAARDDRKSADIATAQGQTAMGSVSISEYAMVRAVLRNDAVRAIGLSVINGSAAATGRIKDPRHAPLATLHGMAHQRKRATIDPFFTAQAIEDQHRTVIETTTARLLGELRENGQFTLDTAALALAVELVASIIGLDATKSSSGVASPGKTTLASRLDAIFANASLATRLPLRRLPSGIRHRLRVLAFHWKDLLPAIAKRRAHPRLDILSLLLSENTPVAAIRSECLAYAAAGIIPTREFITMAAWHLLESGELRARFLAANEAGQIALLEEILRIEPVTSTLYRVAEGIVPAALSIRLQANVPYALDIRAANVAPEAGSCPFAINPEAKRKSGFVHLGFGDGPHRCPGALVALQAARVFIDGLLRVPGVRLEQEPEISWNAAREGYELRGALVCCEPG